MTGLPHHLTAAVQASDIDRARLPVRSKSPCVKAGSHEYVPYSLADVRRESDKAKFTAISMFAGGGGACIGLMLAGGEVIAANEFVPEAWRTYAANFSGHHIDPRDIRLIVNGGAHAFLSGLGLKPRELDILKGAPPCSAWSTAGRGPSDQDELKRYSDTHQRGVATLPFDFADLAKMIAPKVIIMENVPALAGRYGEVLDRILHAVRFNADRSRAYYVRWCVLSADEFGVPQRRQRLFIVGVHVDVAEALGFGSDKSIGAVFPAPPYKSVSVRSALTGLNQSTHDIEPWLRAGMHGTFGRDLRRMPINPDRWLRAHVGLPIEGRYALIRSSWDLPSPTLTASGQRLRGGNGVIHPAEHRKFTVPEIKRLFGLPDDYVLTGTMDQAVERMSRMIPRS